jgi:hypothetical protein
MKWPAPSMVLSFAAVGGDASVAEFGSIAA